MKHAITRIAQNRVKSGVKGKSNKGCMGWYDKHNNRTYDSPHCDPDITPHNHHIIGSGDTQRDFEELCIKHGIDPDKPCAQKNQVYAFDAIFAASGEHWIRDETTTHGWNQEQLDQFIDGVKAFIDKEFPDKCFSLEMHLDESSPHMHAMIAPITERLDKKTGEMKHVMSYNEVMGGSKFRMTELQDSYYECMKDQGFDRGVKGSKAKHVKPADYYAQKAKEEAEKLELSNKIDNKVNKVLKEEPKGLVNKALKSGEFTDKLKETIKEQADTIKALKSAPDAKIAKLESTNKSLSAQLVKVEHENRSLNNIFNLSKNNLLMRGYQKLEKAYKKIKEKVNSLEIDNKKVHELYDTYFNKWKESDAKVIALTDEVKQLNDKLSAGKSEEEKLLLAQIDAMKKHSEELEESTEVIRNLAKEVIDNYPDSHVKTDYEERYLNATQAHDNKYEEFLAVEDGEPEFDTSNAKQAAMAHHNIELNIKHEL